MSDAGPGHDVAGCLCTLTVITPVQPGRERTLGETLAAWGPSKHSPMKQAPRTHIARFYVIDRLPFLVLKRNHLLFNATFDLPWDGWLRELHGALGERTDEMWGNCAGYPAGRGAAAFEAWMLAHRVPARAVVAAAPQARLGDVERALALRHDIARFARASQGRAGDTVLARFEQRFGAV